MNVTNPKNEIIDQILNLFPDFRSDWERYISELKNESPGLCLDLIEFSTWLIKNFGSLHSKSVSELFDLIESWVSQGDQEVQDATATCFLEALQNGVDNKEISGRVLFSFLGPESIAYCRAWDEFNGCKTEGFWEEGAPEFKPRRV